MDINEFLRLGKDDREAVRIWLRENDLDPNVVFEWKQRSRTIRAHVYKTNEDGRKYIIHGSHVNRPGRGCDDECRVAEEWVTVPLRSPAPV